MNRWVCTCAYDGTDFFGWQSQKSGNTIQDILEERLFKIFKEKIRIHGSARTDSGVHAKAQVFHFDAHWEHGECALFKALSQKNPSSIQVISLMRAPEGFHARYSAKGKRYVYTVLLGVASPFQARFVWALHNRYHLDIDAMQKAASSILGKHDFSAFGAIRPDKNQKENPIKNLTRLDVIFQDGKLEFVTEASGYLYKMVRSLVGGLIDVGANRLKVTDFKSILDSKMRTFKIITAPPQGLCLEKVFYEDSFL